MWICSCSTDLNYREPGRSASQDERFASYPRELAVAADLRSRGVARGASDVYVLGDAAVLYVLLGQRPPWQLTVYNTSLIHDQRRVVEWLEDDKLAVPRRRSDSGRLRRRPTRCSRSAGFPARNLELRV